MTNTQLRALLSSAAALPTPIRLSDGQVGDVVFTEKRNLPKSVRIAYQTEEGETRYKSFVPDVTQDIEDSAEDPDKSYGDGVVANPMTDCELVGGEKAKATSLRTEEWVRSVQKDH